MRRIVDFLAPLGLLVIAGAVGLERAGKTLPGKHEYYWVAGSALIVTHLLLRFEDIARALGARQLRYGGNTAVFTLVVLGILVAVNYLAARHTKRWDLTKNQRYSLSDQTKKVLQNLKEDVSITYFDKTDEMSRGQERMKPFQSTTTRLKVSFVDPLKNPARAREADVTTVPTLILERGSRKEKVTGDTEQDVTNALIKVTRDAKKTICFVEGEGERDTDDTRGVGYSAAKNALTRSQYDVKKVLLLREGKVPADCTVVLVAGPEKDLLPQALDAIRDFVKGGGKALIMVEPEFKESYPNLTGLLKEWNIETGKDVVVDAS
ncbi:MAG TPA: GldG family protein, partial [Vicinamibacteria bacterium]|nr:GldG family protein [Vicinamibacteria bacterium]